MKSNLNKQDILEAFQLMQDILDCNVVEYKCLKWYPINGLKVIEWLKSVGKYNDKNYLSYAHLMTYNLYSDDELRAEITNKKLDTYSFTDFDSDFADVYYDSDGSNTGYELTAEFLLSEYCTEEEFNAFMDDMLSVNKCDDEEEDYINLTETEIIKIKEMRNKIL